MNTRNVFILQGTQAKLVKTLQPALKAIFYIHGKNTGIFKIKKQLFVYFNILRTKVLHLFLLFFQVLCTFLIHFVQS